MTLKHKLRTRALETAVGLALVSVLAWALWPAALAVRTARVTRGPLTATVESEGRTRVKRDYIVSAPVDGELERIDAEPGAQVTAATVLARIRPAASRPLDPRSRAEAIAAVTAAQASVARADAAQAEAKVALEHAESVLAETQQLASNGAAPASKATHTGHEVQLRRRALDEAAAAARQARAELARATALLEPGKGEGELVPVTSPAQGQLLRVLRENAGPVAAGTPLAEVGDVGELEVVADLLSDDAALVRAGADAAITTSQNKRRVRARVRRVEPAAFMKVSALGLQEQRVNVILDFAEPVPQGLGHDYRVDVAIAVWKGDRVLRVPSTALFRSGEHWAVFAIRDGRARLVPLRVGPADTTQTVVESGLLEGDQVITQPSDQILDGTRVRPR